MNNKDTDQSARNSSAQANLHFRCTHMALDIEYIFSCLLQPMGINHPPPLVAAGMVLMFIKWVKNLQPLMDVTIVCVQNRACNVQPDHAQTRALVSKR